jgi:hypothetical protein
VTTLCVVTVRRRIVASPRPFWLVWLGDVAAALLLTVVASSFWLVLVGIVVVGCFHRLSSRRLDLPCSFWLVTWRCRVVIEVLGRVIVAGG